MMFRNKIWMIFILDFAEYTSSQIVNKKLVAEMAVAKLKSKFNQSFNFLRILTNI
jgi:hypothetical protein